MASASAPAASWPPWMRDGGPRPLRARILQRRAARRAGSRAPELARGDCGACGGWGVVGGNAMARKRCTRCRGSGHSTNPAGKWRDRYKAEAAQLKRWRARP